MMSSKLENGEEALDEALFTEVVGQGIRHLRLLKN